MYVHIVFLYYRTGYVGMSKNRYQISQSVQVVAVYYPGFAKLNQHKKVLNRQPTSINA